MACARITVTATASVLGLSVAVACNMPNPAFGLDTGTGGGPGGSGGGGTRGGSATSTSGTGTASGTGTGTSGTSTGMPPGSTAGTSIGTAGFIDAGGATAGSTGGPPVCELPEPVGDLDIGVKLNENPVTEPNGSVTIQGRLIEYQAGEWKLVSCQGKGPCDPTCTNPDVFEKLVINALPGPDWGPPEPNMADQCYTANVYWNGDGTFQGADIWETLDNNVVKLVWVGRGEGPEPAVFMDLPFSVAPSLSASCACSMDACCLVEPPGEYKLKVSGITLNGGNLLASGECRTGVLNATEIKVLNNVSVAYPECGVNERFSWILKASAGNPVCP